jgi:molybdopterin synthase catalytic subunit/molybdopterin converting factor small subunit
VSARATGRAIDVEVVLFAVAAERAGRRRLCLRVEPAASTVVAADVRRALLLEEPALGAILPSCALAFDDAYAGDEDVVPPGATVAVIPPVSGGAEEAPYARIEDGAIDPTAIALRVADDASGGTVVFLGTVRSRTGEQVTERLEYESHRPLAEREMARILSEVAAAVAGSRLAAAHRVGRLAVGEVAVVVAASAPHRDGAFLAARTAIDRIKAEVPIWKREVGPDGAVWVEGSTVPAARPKA